jgi:hypothetical protein
MARWSVAASWLFPSRRTMRPRRPCSCDAVGFRCRGVSLHLVCAARHGVGDIVTGVPTFASELVDCLTNMSAGPLILSGGPIPEAHR